MKFSNFLGIRDIKDLGVRKYNQDIADIRQWWDEHDSASRAFTFVSVSSAGIVPGTVANLFQIINDNTPYQVFEMATFGNTGLGGQNNMHFYRARGTFASPTATQSGDIFKSEGARGHDGTNFTGSMIAQQYIATENWTPTKLGTRIQFDVTPTGTNARIDAFEITGVGVKVPLGIIGTATNDNATAGNVGEFVQSFIPAASAVSLSTANTAFNVTSISLTAGDWDISAMGAWTSNTVNTSSGNPYFDVWVNSTTASYTGANLGDNYGELPVPSGLTPAVVVSIVIPAFRVSLSSTTTYYLNAASGTTYTAGFPKAYGRISARRVR